MAQGYEYVPQERTEYPITGIQTNRRSVQSVIQVRTRSNANRTIHMRHLEPAFLMDIRFNDSTDVFSAPHAIACHSIDIVRGHDGLTAIVNFTRRRP